jgi:methylthioribose-1-phosphate isomerase
MRRNTETIRSIARDPATGIVTIIDQTQLPHRFVLVPLTSMAQAAHAIRAMLVRGAPLIGATAAYGVALAMRADPSDGALAGSLDVLGRTRPTAVNLMWAFARMRDALARLSPSARPDAAMALADAIAEEDVALCRAMGAHGVALIDSIARRKAGRVNILTHCNAGALATVDIGTATAPIYAALDKGLDIHVWVDETRPRNQGASLTAFELLSAGVPHTVIPDNTGGHLMRQGLVDLVIVGTDRVAANGDVANKIGTYLKALAARDNGVPFYVALPSPTLDLTLASGDLIPIEERGGEEVSHMSGLTAQGTIETVRVVPDGSPVANFGFDVTPARLVTGLITERGVIAANRTALVAAFGDRESRAA